MQERATLFRRRGGQLYPGEGEIGIARRTEDLPGGRGISKCSYFLQSKKMEHNSS